jgi:RHS repeat-associated protein
MLFGFAGRATDDHTDLQYVRSRHFQSRNSVWTSRDLLTVQGPPIDWPIEWPVQSLSIGEEVNAYRYLLSAPTNVVDPYGTAGIFAIVYLTVMVALMAAMFEYVFPMTIDVVYTTAAQNGYNATIGLRGEFTCRVNEARLRLDMFSPVTDSFWSRLGDIALESTRADVSVRDYAPSSPNLGTALPTLHLMLINRKAVTDQPWTSYPMLLFIIYLAELQHLAGGKSDSWPNINKELDDLIEFFGLGPRPPIWHGGGL